LEDPDVDGRILLKWIFETLDGREWTDRSGSGQGQVAGSHECGNEPLGSIQCGECLK
jgi:hypothetical protein